MLIKLHRVDRAVEPRFPFRDRSLHLVGGVVDGVDQSMSILLVRRPFHFIFHLLLHGVTFLGRRRNYGSCHSTLHTLIVLRFVPTFQESVVAGRVSRLDWSGLCGGLTYNCEHWSLWLNLWSLLFGTQTHICILPLSSLPRLNFVDGRKVLLKLSCC